VEFFSIFILIWNEVIIRPMLNTLLVLYVLCFTQMGVAIIVFTALVRVVTIPLTVRQLRQMRAMTGMQPRVREIQQRYEGDRQRISQETMRLYRESGVNPIGCLGPLIVQMPILIGLFRVLILTLFNNPEDLVNLSDKLYPWITFVPIHSAAPVNNTFLWLDLSQPDPSPIVSHADPGGGHHLGAAEDDADAFPGSASAIEPNDDVVDDAHLPWSILPGLAQRTAPLLGGFQPHRHHDPVFHHRLGAIVPAVPTARAGRRRSDSGSPVSRPSGE